MIKNIFFREATLNDAEILFQLSNEDSVRANSINKNKIKWDNHVNWLKEKFASENYSIFLFFYENEFLGQVKFESQNHELIISLCITEKFRGKKLAVPILKKGIEKIFEKNKIAEKVIAYIRPENYASIKSFTNVGFVFSELVEINEDQFNKYLLLRESCEKK